MLPVGRIHVNAIYIDDDHIETTIFTRFSSRHTLDTDPPVNCVRSPSVEEEDSEGHGKTTDSTIACCRKYSDGQVNCDSCLNTALKLWAIQSDEKEQEVSRRILDELDKAGPAGLDISTLIVSVAIYQLCDDKLNDQSDQTSTMRGGCSETVLSVIASLMDNPIPLIVLVGHSRPLVVSARWSDTWTVTISEVPRINVLPRRWLDLRGAKVQETWRAALRAVIGTIVFRPGISQVSDYLGTRGRSVS